MSARSLHIANYAEALAAGTIPAQRTDSGFEFPAVVSVNSHNARLVWQIKVTAQDSAGVQIPINEQWLQPGAEPPVGTVGLITTEGYQISNGGVRGPARSGVQPTFVRTGKNLGKSNASNAITQALREALGRYNGQVKRARPPPSEDRDLECDTPPPMLVKKHGESRDATLTAEDFKRGVTVQRKLNGVRVVVFRGGLQPAKVVMYSRTATVYSGFAHIRREALDFLDAPPQVPDELLCPQGGVTPDELARLRAIYQADHPHLDGEIYLHGRSLRWISGQARRAEDEGSLDYMVFDCFFPTAIAAGHNMIGGCRQKYLDILFAAAARRHGQMAHILRVENFAAAQVADITALRDQFIAEGYEGAIARKNCAGYRYGANNYHSANIVKFKPVYDDEFEVVGYAEGEKGKDVGAVIWICAVDPAHVRDPADYTFRVVPKDMTYDERYSLFRRMGEMVANSPTAIAAGKSERVTRFERDFKGRLLTVEYPERSTKTGKPVQAKAVAFRTYEEGSNPLSSADTFESDSYE
jgi:ATP-dependent DNA ligase